MTIDATEMCNLGDRYRDNSGLSMHIAAMKFAIAKYRWAVISQNTRIIALSPLITRAWGVVS